MIAMLFKRYHAHVYFDANQEAHARALRQQLAGRFPVYVGTLHRQAIGPHPKGMFQVVFDDNQLGQLLPWLMQERQDLVILVHADSGDDQLDHTRHVMWLGQSLPLDLSVLTSA